MYVLRPDQQECVDAVWNAICNGPKALAVASTGAGKSVVIYELLRRSISVRESIKCLVLFNRVTLLNQLAERFQSAIGHDKVGIYCGTNGVWDSSRAVTVGSIQSLDPEHLNFNLIIIDECHSLNEQSGRYIEFIKKQMDQNPRTKVVGFTATDYRIDGYIHGKNKFWPPPCYKRGLRFYIDQGLLVPPLAKQPDHTLDLSKLRVLRGDYRQDDIDAQTLNIGMARDQVTDALNRSIGRKKLVWFCSSINHAELIRNLLTEMGEKAVCLHSKMTWDERDHSQDEFENKDARHLTFVTVVSEGYDYPPIDCVVLMRPTKSASLMVQTCGRGLRLWPGKSDCLILDYANVISTLGPLDDPSVGKKSKGKSEQAPTQKACPNCRTYVAPRAMNCPQCGFNWPKLEATKISLTADENAEFMTKKLKEMEVSDVRMSKHVSKAGNTCIKLEYMAKGFLQPSISEYFALENDWAVRKFTIRAIEMQFVLKSDIDDQTREPILRKPTKILYQIDGKYEKVKSLVFARSDGTT